MREHQSLDALAEETEAEQQDTELSIGNPNPERRAPRPFHRNGEGDAGVREGGGRPPLRLAAVGALQPPRVESDVAQRHDRPRPSPNRGVGRVVERLNDPRQSVIDPPRSPRRERPAVAAGVVRPRAGARWSPARGREGRLGAPWPGDQQQVRDHPPRSSNALGPLPPVDRGLGSPRAAHHGYGQQDRDPLHRGYSRQDRGRSPRGSSDVSPVSRYAHYSRGGGEQPRTGKDKSLMELAAFHQQQKRGGIQAPRPSPRAQW